jgi:ABC-type antimicrobial peptide transport system permease subunit
MLKNYFKIALRNIFRHKTYSFINILGFGIGLACCLLISLWVYDELSFDKFHDDHENIYRAVLHQEYSKNQQMEVAVTPGLLGPALLEEYPEVTNMARYERLGQKELILDEEYAFDVGGAAVDPSFFQIFNFPLHSGSLSKFVDASNVIVLTQKAAQKIFKDANPIGKNLTISFDKQYNVTVVGIMQDIPPISHIEPGFLVPFKFYSPTSNNTEDWGSNRLTTYLKVQQGTVQEELEAKISGRIKEAIPQAASDVYLQRLDKIHLYSDFVADSTILGDIRYVRLFLIVAVFILIICSINFISITTARSISRAKEIGIRKVVGSNRGSLVWQFLVESVLMTLLAMILALLLSEIAMPYFNQIAGKQIANIPSQNVVLLLICTAASILIGLLAGLYPAFALSGFKIIPILKGKLRSGKSAENFRKILVISQWTISIILIIATIIAYQQMQFIFNKDLGWQKENLLYVYMDSQLQKEYWPLKQELLQQTNIKSICGTSSLPVSVSSSSSGLDWEGRSDEESFLIHFLNTDKDFIKTFDLKLQNNQQLPQVSSADTTVYAILNQKAIKAMNVGDPLNRDFTMWSYPIEVVGVVHDFNFKHFRYNIEPLIILMQPDNQTWLSNYFRPTYLVVKFTGEAETAINTMRTTWQKFYPNKTFNYHFVDDRFERMYDNEKKVGKLFQIFSILTIFIACMGLFALSTFMVQQRQKEIGIRKVMGATLSSVVSLLTSDLMKLVLIANLIAWPLAWLVMRSWLNNFVYRIKISPLVFVFAALVALAITMLTVSYQAVRAGLKDPVKTIRYE